MNWSHMKVIAIKKSILIILSTIITTVTHAKVFESIDDIIADDFTKHQPNVKQKN